LKNEKLEFDEDHTYQIIVNLPKLTKKETKADIIKQRQDLILENSDEENDRNIDF
jgi:hypothetical protein